MNVESRGYRVCTVAALHTPKRCQVEIGYTQQTLFFLAFRSTRTTCWPGSVWHWHEHSREAGLDEPRSQHDSEGQPAEGPWCEDRGRRGHGSTSNTQISQDLHDDRTTSRTSRTLRLACQRERCSECLEQGRLQELGLPAERVPALSCFWKLWSGPPDMGGFEHSPDLGFVGSGCIGFSQQLGGQSRAQHVHLV